MGIEDRPMRGGGTGYCGTDDHSERLQMPGRYEGTENEQIHFSMHVSTSVQNKQDGVSKQQAKLEMIPDV